MAAEMNHPDPTLVRRNWGSLNGSWRYGVAGQRWAEARRAEDGRFDTEILVPFPPESAASGVGEEPNGVLWYRRALTLTPAPGNDVRLHFGAVDYRTRVWLDDRLLIEHVGGHVPFHVDVPGAWLAGEHTLTVAALDPREDRDQPRGKQDWQDEPHVIWYKRTSGIWRDVWWEELPLQHLEDVQWLRTQPDGRVAARIRAQVAGAASVELSVRLGEDDLGSTVAPVEHGAAEVAMRLRDLPDTDLRWSLERPTLLDARLRLLDADGGVLDEATTRIGLRTVEVADGAVLLNGAPVFLRFVLEQLYWPASHLAAPDADALRAEAKLIRDLGFNGLRTHQVTPDPRFLAACDELGLLVICDLPAPMRFSVEAFENAVGEWCEVVRAHRGHPSVIGWMPYNESWGVPEIASSPQQRDAVAATHYLLKTLDPTRLVLGNDGWEHTLGDLIGIHDYTHDPALLESRYGDAAGVWRVLRRGGHIHRPALLDHTVPESTPVWLSEFGGVSVNTSDAAWSGYGGVGADELLSTLDAVVTPVLRSSGLVGYCYTQLTDTEQEQNGLTDAARVPKAPIEDLRRIFSGQE